MHKPTGKSIAAAKLIFRAIKAAYIVTGILFLLQLTQDIVFSILAARGILENENSMTISAGNYLYLLAPLAGIMTVGTLRKFINLGGKRNRFEAGCLSGFIILAGAISLANIGIYLVYDPLITRLGHSLGTINLLDVFGWSGHGFLAFVQQAAFLFLLTIFFHTLAALHYCWIGLAADILLAAVISVFTPIAPLRAAEAAFFNLILFHPHALAQIFACLFLGLGLLALNKVILVKRPL
jgi:hypothetical protein